MFVRECQIHERERGEASYEMNVFNRHAKDRLAITGEEKVKVDLHTEPNNISFRNLKLNLL